MAGKEYEFITFDEGVQRINEALHTLGLSPDKRDTVVTSRDPIGQRLRETLNIATTPKGITKWQLPVYWEGKGAQFFISIAEPNTRIDEHSHQEGSGIRFVSGGSIVYGGQELSAGDWMFIPEGVSYSFEAGPLGAVMCYCYQCCCVPR